MDILGCIHPIIQGPADGSNYKINKSVDLMNFKAFVNMSIGFQFTALGVYLY